MRFPVTPIHTDSLVTGVPGPVRVIAAPRGTRGHQPRRDRARERSA